MPLHYRLFAAVVLPLALCLVGLGWLTSFWAEESIRESLDARLHARALLLARAVHKTIPSTVFLDPYEQKAGAAFLELTRSLDGATRWRSYNDGPDLPFTDETRSLALKARPIIETVFVRGHGEVRLATCTVLHHTGDSIKAVSIAQSGLPLASTEHSIARLRQLVWSAVAMGIAAAGAIAWLVLREWLSSFESLTRGARKLATAFTARERLAVPHSDPAVAAVARDFNMVLDRLERAIQSQEQFTADASHELRTPLSILRSEIEVALRRERNVPQYREALENCREEAERLARLVENLLSLARADVGQEATTREIVNLGALTLELKERFRPLCEAAHVSILHDSQGPCEVVGDPLAIERLFTNLIDNAIRHSSHGEQVAIRVRGGRRWVTVEIIDHGPGIPPEQLPTLFERFHRLDKARSRKHGGAGLGLAIVKSLTEAQRGRVEVESQFGLGATFRVLLPAFEPEQPPRS